MLTSKHALLYPHARPFCAGNKGLLEELLTKGKVPAAFFGSACLVAAVRGTSLGTGPACKAHDAHAAEMCKLLLRHGAGSRADSSAALVLACERGMAQTCSVLLEGGADARAPGTRSVDTERNVLQEVNKLERMVSSGAMGETDLTRMRDWLGSMKKTMARISSRLDARQDELLDVDEAAGRGFESQGEQAAGPSHGNVHQPQGQGQPATCCAACGAAPPVGLKKCSGCMGVRYCSKQCQSQHWPEHKADCVRARMEQGVLSPIQQQQQQQPAQ